MYANLKNSELYILIKDYYDKYVKVPVEDITADFDTSLSAGQIANIKKFKKLYELVQQFASIFDIEDARETIAIAEANYVVNGIESGCALSKFMGDDICSDGATITEALEFVSLLDNANIEYISYFDGAVHYLRLTTNGKTVIYKEGDVTVY